MTPLSVSNRLGAGCRGWRSGGSPGGIPVTHLFCAVALLFVCAGTGYPQYESAQAETPRYKVQTLTISVGAGIPQSKGDLKGFWGIGPSASFSFFVNVSRAVALGLGAEAALLPFNEGAFRSAYPTVPVQARDVVQSNLYVGAKFSLAPSMRLCPYMSTSVGASLLTRASYKNPTIGQRHQYYYNVGGIARLHAGLAGGVDLYLNRWLAMQLEAKATYVHNDPNVRVTSFMRGGFRLTL